MSMENATLPNVPTQTATLSTTTTPTTLSTTTMSNVFHQSVLGWSWGLVLFVLLSSFLLVHLYRKENSLFSTALAVVLWCALLFSLVAIGVLAVALESADEFNVASTVLLAAASITFIGIGVFGTIYQARTDRQAASSEEQKRRDDDLERINRANEELVRYQKEQTQYQQKRAEDAKQYQEARAESETKRRYDYATLFVNITDRMLNNTDCRKAISMLGTRSGDAVEFPGEQDTTSGVDDASQVKQLAQNRNGNVQHWDSFEVALALDSRLESDCFWVKHDMRKGYRWAYHKDMRDAVVAFATWLSYVREVCEQGKTNPPPAIAQYIALLAPVSQRAHARQKPLDGERFAKLFFVWRRLLDSYPAVANAIAPWVFDTNVRWSTLQWWREQISQVGDAKAMIKQYAKNIDAASPIDSDKVVPFCRALLEYLAKARLAKPPPTLAFRKVSSREVVEDKA